MFLHSIINCIMHNIMYDLRRKPTDQPSGFTQGFEATITYQRITRIVATTKNTLEGHQVSTNIGHA